MTLKGNQYNPFHDILALDEGNLRSYLVDRLSGKEPFVPPLRNPDESPRHFVENLMVYGRKADPDFLRRIDNAIQTILASFLGREAKERLEKGSKEDLTLLSHCLYLAGKFRLQSCMETILRLYMSGVRSDEPGPLGRLETLLADAVGVLIVPARAQAFWQSIFVSEEEARERITAFVNLYLVDPVSAYDAAEKLLKQWASGEIGELLDFAGVLTRYLDSMVTSTRAPQRASPQYFVRSLVNLAYQSLPRPKIQELFDEMKKFDELTPYIIEDAPISVVAVESEPDGTTNILSSIAREQDWTIGHIERDISGRLFSDARGVVVCVLDLGNQTNPLEGKLTEVASFIYEGMNRKDAMVMFVLNETLWKRLRELVEQTICTGRASLPLTSLETTRITYFSPGGGVAEKVRCSIDLGLIVHACAKDGTGIAAEVFDKAKGKAVWPANALYRRVSHLFDPLVGSDSASLRRDCFTAVICSLADRDRRLSYEPTTGLWGCRLEDVRIRTQRHPFNVGW